MIYLNIYSVNRIQGNLIFLGRSNTSPPPHLFLPHPPATCVFPDIPSEHTWGSLPRCIHLQGQCYRNTLWAALRTGTVPGALCTSLRAGPSITAEKAQAVEKRNIMLDEKLAVEKDMVFGEGIPALLSIVAGVAMGAVPPPLPGLAPSPSLSALSFPERSFCAAKAVI